MTQPSSFVTSHNRPLLIGAAIVLVLIVIALLGPALAPHDPLERTLIAQIGGRTVGAPFPPFQSWDFPLGSDRFGRDLFSRLLYAIRPTLMLAVFAALVRLTLGVLIGAIAGWSQQGLGARFLNRLIDAALGVPVLVTALAMITLIGVERGLPAFLLGLTITGWAETAQTVRAQTRRIAIQPYITAARALGSNTPQLLLRHVSRHLTPLLGPLLAFEVSAVLLLTAGLAFLGYFIGGGVWVITSGELIPNAVRVAGLPELGQMVGTAEIRISSRPPWEMIFPGATMVVAILAFALLGEGLRRSVIERPVSNGFMARLLAAPLSRLEESLVTRAGNWSSQTTGWLYGLILAGVVGGSAWIWWQIRPPEVAARSDVPGLAIDTPGWSAQRGDPYGSLRGDVVPLAVPTTAWTFGDRTDLSAPVVAPDGTVYVSDAAGAVLALDRSGNLVWEAPLDDAPVGSPALGPNGTIYATDARGGLYALEPAGQRLWRFQTTYRASATSAPIVARDGTIFYAVIDAVQAVAPDGTAKWLGRDPSLPFQDFLPRLSPDQSLVFLKNRAFQASDGSPVPLTIVPDETIFAEGAFIIGADGSNYYRSEHRIIPWRRVEAGVAMQPPLTWSASNAFFMPADTGVSTNGIAWFLYAAEFADTRLIWISSEGVQLREVFHPWRSSRVFVTFDDGSLLACGRAPNRRPHCGLFNPESDTPLWEEAFANPGDQMRGVAQDAERLYFSIEGVGLVALDLAGE